jgi:hypothetical protein
MPPAEMRGADSLPERAVVNASRWATNEGWEYRQTIQKNLL